MQTGAKAQGNGQQIRKNEMSIRHAFQRNFSLLKPFFFCYFGISERSSTILRRSEFAPSTRFTSHASAVSGTTSP